MKKHFILAAMAMTALFCACSNDDSTPLNEGTVPVSFTIGGIDSRATTAADFTTTFDNNDKIGIYATNVVTPEMNNEQYNVTVNGSEANIEPVNTSASFAYGEGTAIFNAYYPYSAEFANTFAVQTDQSTETNFKNSDFLTATATGSTSSPQVTLEFSHRLVLVQVKLTGIANVSNVKLKNAKTKVDYVASTSEENESTITLASTKNDPTDILMFPETVNSNYWAIIPAQDIAAGQLIEVTTSDNTYSYSTTGTTFTAKSVVKFSLKLAGSGDVEENELVAYSPVTISKWNAEAAELEGQLGVDIYNLKSVTGRTVLKGENSAWGYNFQDNSAGTVIYDAENDAIASTITTAPSSYNWGKTATYYYSGTNQTLEPNAEYEISFDTWIKNSNPSENKLQITVSNSTGFYSLHDGTYAIKTEAVNQTVTSKKIKVFTKNFITSTSPASQPTWNSTSPEEASSFYIGFAPQTLNTYYIRNLVITKVETTNTDSEQTTEA